MAFLSLHTRKTYRTVINCKHIPQKEYENLYHLTKSRNKYEINANVYDEGVLLEITPAFLDEGYAKAEQDYPVLASIVKRLDGVVKNETHYLDLCEYIRTCDDLATWDWM